MTKRERVWAAIKHQETKQVPKGEILIAQELWDRGWGDKLERKKRFLEELGLDLIVIQLSQQEKELLKEEIQWWASQTDFFVFLLVNGGFQETCSRWGWQETILATLNRPAELETMIARQTQANIQLTLDLLPLGGNGIIIGEDIAYQKGTFISPQSLKKIVFPGLEQMIKAFQDWQVPVFFHSDGNIQGVLDEIVNLGFAGLQGLEPSAGMDLTLIKQKYGDKLCLMGNIDLGALSGSIQQEELALLVEQTIEAGRPGGGYIFGTSGGLGNHLSLEKIRLLYQLAANHSPHS